MEEEDKATGELAAPTDFLEEDYVSAIWRHRTEVVGSVEEEDKATGELTAPTDVLEDLKVLH